MQSQRIYSRIFLLTIGLLGSVTNIVVALEGGKRVNNGNDYSYLYYIKLMQTHSAACAATAISPNHLVTAGHCLKHYWNYTTKESSYTYYVHQGNSDTNLEHTKGVIPIDPKDVTFHPKFELKHCAVHDVAIITLPEKRLSGKFLPLCFHLHDDLEALSFVNRKFDLTGTIYSCPFQLNPSATCDNKYIANNSAQICITPNECVSEMGDSGSPLITRTKIPCLIGILSCGSPILTVYCSVPDHRDWIESSLIIPSPPNTSNDTTSNGSVDTIDTKSVGSLKIVLFEHVVITLLLLILLITVIVMFKFILYYF